MDPFEQFKAAQRAGWAHFAPLQTFTTIPADRLVEHAGIRAGMTIDPLSSTAWIASSTSRVGQRSSPSRQRGGAHA